MSYASLADLNRFTRVGDDDDGQAVLDAVTAAARTVCRPVSADWSAAPDGVRWIVARAAARVYDNPTGLRSETSPTGYAFTTDAIDLLTAPEREDLRDAAGLSSSGMWSMPLSY